MKHQDENDEAKERLKAAVAKKTKEKLRKPGDGNQEGDGEEEEVDFEQRMRGKITGHKRKTYDVETTQEETDQPDMAPPTRSDQQRYTSTYHSTHSQPVERK